MKLLRENPDLRKSLQGQNPAEQLNLIKKATAKERGSERADNELDKITALLEMPQKAQSD